MFPHRDETGRESTVIVVETVKEFVSFHYEVLLEDEIVERKIRLRILGLHTPVSVMPGTGPARGVRWYPRMKGNISVHVRKLDGEENEFDVHCSRETIRLVRSPAKPFILFSTDPLTLET